MDLASNYEISRTAEFIRSRGFTRVALQFPDELLKDSAVVARTLREELRRHGGSVRLFVLADTAYGSCCVDEVGASHVEAECVVHYGHACMSPTSALPAFFIFRKVSVDVKACSESIFQVASKSNKPVMVLFGLEYAHALQSIKEAVTELLQLCESKQTVQYAELTCSFIEPSLNFREADDNTKSEYLIENSLGGLTWKVLAGRTMEDYILFWIGLENSAFANFVLTFNNCEIVRYDTEENRLLKDLFHQKRILKRRYYLVEKAKDANIVGILVGTLGVAGYLRIIDQMKKLIQRAGKKSYTFVMGRPNAAKLANFPECDIFVYVSCAQTALLDGKDLLAPVITPFEALLAYDRGRQWTGEYVMAFQHLMDSPSEVVDEREEARFSFFHGGYIEDIQQGDNGKEAEDMLALADITEKALKLRSECSDAVLYKGAAKTGAEYLAARSYQGLNPNYENALPETYVIGRTGRAAGYKDENRQT